MAIQLPRIKQNDVTGATRLPEAEAIGAEGIYNIAKGNIKLVEAVGKTVVDVVDNYDKMLDAAAKAKAKELLNRYNAGVDTLSVQFSSLPLGGDLTEQYNEVKKQQDNNAKMALELAKDERTKEYVRRGIIEQDAVLNRPIELKYAQANVAYKVSEANISNENLKRNFMTQAAFFNPKDPTSYAMLDEMLGSIDKNAKDTAYSLGLTTKDSAGQEVYPESVAKDIKNSKSEAVLLSVNSLLGVNDPMKAKAFLTRYSGLLDSKSLTDVTNKVNSAIRERRYHEAAIAIARDPDKTKQNAAVEKFAEETKDPEAKTRVGNLVSSINTKNQVAINQKQEELYNSVAEDLLKNQSNPSTRFYTPDEIRINPTFNQRYQMLSPENKRKVEGLIKRPTESDPKTLAKFEKQSNSSEGWTNVPSNTFLKEGAKLNDLDFSIYQAQFKNSKKTKAEKINEDVRNGFVNEVKKALEAAKILPKPTDKDHLREWNDKYAQRVINELNKLTPSTTRTSLDYTQGVKRVVDDIMRDDYDNSNVFRKALKYRFDRPEGSSTPPPNTTPSGTRTQKDMIDDL